MNVNSRPCPRAAKGAEHDMRRDAGGRWYCPIERDAELAARYREESA